MATHTLLLQRQKEYKDVPPAKAGGKVEDATIGKGILFKNDEPDKILWDGVSCENGGPSTTKRGSDKRILARTYQLRWSSSGVNGGLTRAFPKWLVSSKDCPVKITDGTTGANVVLWTTCKEDKEHAGRRVHIHSGIHPNHTESCVLFAEVDNKNGTTSQSAKSINALFNEVAKIGVENIDFIIKEIEDKQWKK